MNRYSLVKFCVAAPGLILATPASAAAAGAEGATALLHGIMLAAVYALVGALILLLCFKGFDKAITKIDLEQAIEKGNVSAGIFSGAIVIGIAIVIAAAIAG
jgi:uncharacterized membrane protein YjfL (UPF0719 family)